MSLRSLHQKRSRRLETQFAENGQDPNNVSKTESALTSTLAGKVERKRASKLWSAKTVVRSPLYHAYVKQTFQDLEFQNVIAS